MSQFTIHRKGKKLKNIEMNFVSRLGMSNFLAQATGPLGKISALQRILDEVRFSDEEIKNIKVTEMGNGVSSYEAPSPAFGVKNVVIEEADVAFLSSELDSYQHFRITDMPWVQAVKAQLNGNGRK